MPNIHETNCDTFTVTGTSRVWRIIPDCIKKNGTNKKQQEHIENIKFTDTSVNTLPDTKTDDQTIVGSDRKDLQITQATKISLGNRKSWTYGSRIERNSCDKDIKDFKHFDIMEDKENVEEGEALNRVIELDSLQRVRELQREHSFPGKLTSASLTKHEARRRLMSWKKTTIARKNSEKQD